MSRTILDIEISNRKVDEVKDFIFKWLEKKGFAVLSMCSDGSEQVFGYFGARTRLIPKIGNIVTIHYKATGAIVFEINIHAINDHINVHGEFYVAGASIFTGKEFDLNPDVLLMGRWPRKKGHKFKEDFEYNLRSISK